MTQRLAEGGADTSALAIEQAEAGDDLERLGGWERLHEAEAIISALGIQDPSRLAGTLSGGERRRVALARVLVGEPTLAILDEPTNHLDVETIEWLEDYLLDRFRGALLLITHDRYVLDRVATRTMDLEDGVLTTYNGGYATYLAARAERKAHAERAERNRQNFLRRELEWLRRQPKARGTKQKARIDRAHAAIESDAPKRDRQAVLRVDAARQGKTVLEIEGLRLERGGACLIDDLELRISAGQRVGVVGPNGAGKTSLLLAVLGQLEATAGNIALGQNARVGVLDQGRSGLEPEQTVFESLGDRSHVESGGERLDLAQYLERFLFDRREQRVKVGQLSGGERARVCLAKLLAEKANLLLLDEPTNDLDVSTLAALEEMLTESPTSAIVVSHDRWFLDRIATSILVFEGDGRVVLHAGNYSDYRERVGPTRPPTPPAEPQRRAEAESTLPPPSKPAGIQKLSFNEKRELAGLLDEIEASETEVAQLEDRLASPETYKSEDPQTIAELKQALAAANERTEALTDRWEELEVRREATK